MPPNPLSSNKAIPPGRLPKYTVGNKTIQLWTVQPHTVINQLQQNKIVHADSTTSETRPDYPEAYQWIAHKISNLPGTPHNYNPKNPSAFWAWANTTRYDLILDTARYARGHLNTNTTPYLITLNIPLNRIILTEYNAWHVILMTGVLYTHEENQLAENNWDWEHPLETQLRKESPTRQYPEAPPNLKHQIQQTWENAIVQPNTHKHIQASFAHIETNDIIKITQLNGHTR